MPQQATKAKGSDSKRKKHVSFVLSEKVVPFPLPMGVHTDGASAVSNLMNHAAYPGDNGTSGGDPSPAAGRTRDGTEDEEEDDDDDDDDTTRGDADDVYTRREEARAKSFGVRKAGVSKLRPYVYPDGYVRQDTPVYIIREYFSSLSTRSLVVDWAFEDFDAVLKGIKPSYEAGATIGAWDIVQLTRLYVDRGDIAGESGRTPAWDPAGMYGRRGVQGHSVYMLLASRMDYTSRLMEMDWIPKHVRQALAAHLDTHLPLAIHMELLSRFDDSCMERPVELPRQEVGTAHSGGGSIDGDGILMPMTEYEYFMPRLALVFHQGELPDMIMLMPYAGFFGNEKETPFTDEDSQIILAILKKCVYFGCKGRSAGYIMSENFEPCPLLFHCFVRMLMCTLLGGYDHCDYLPGLRARMMVYKWFSSTGYPTLGDITSFARRNSELARLVVQEYILFAVAQLPSLRSYLMESGYHKIVEGYAFECMDMIRKVVAKNMEEIHHTGSCESGTRDWFEGTPAIISNYNTLKLEYAYKPTDCSFADHVGEITRAIDGAMFNKAGFMKTEKEKVVNARRAVIREVIDLHGPYGPVSYEWLCERFKVSMANIDMLKIAEKLYVTESSTVDVENVINDIVRRSPWDYHVIKTLFRELIDARKLKFFKLPYHIVMSQIEALHRIYKTAPGEELHPDAGTYYICTSCYEFKAPLVEHEDGEDGAKNMWTKGVDNVYLDTDSWQLLCLNKVSKSTKKHKAEDDKNNAAMKASKSASHPLGFFDDRIVTRDYRCDNAYRSRRSNKIENEIAEERNCKSKPVTKINLLGYMMVIEGSKKILLCPLCASPTTMRWYKYGRFGLACMCTTYEKSPLKKHYLDEIQRSVASRLVQDGAEHTNYLSTGRGKRRRTHQESTHSTNTQGASRISKGIVDARGPTKQRAHSDMEGDTIVSPPHVDSEGGICVDATSAVPSESGAQSTAIAPVYNKDGSIRKKRGRKPKTQSMQPLTVPAVDSGTIDRSSNKQKGERVSNYQETKAEECGNKNDVNAGGSNSTRARDTSDPKHHSTVPPRPGGMNSRNAAGGNNRDKEGKNHNKAKHPKKEKDSSKSKDINKDKNHNKIRSRKMKNDTKKSKIGNDSKGANNDIDSSKSNDKVSE